MKLSLKILYIYSGVSVYRLVRLFVRCVRRQDATFVPVVSARPSPDTVWLPLPSSSVSNDNPIVADWLCACVAHGADTDKAQRARTIKRCWWLQPRGLCAPAQCRLGPRNRARACWVDVGVLVSHHASRRIPRCSSTASLTVWCRQTDSPGVRCRCGEPPCHAVVPVGAPCAIAQTVGASHRIPRRYDDCNQLIGHLHVEFMGNAVRARRSHATGSSNMAWHVMNDASHQWLRS